ncbi:hypothetical protein QN277_019674 [Acacia crassicarpa]|uniref:Uncharacterized protein n=1 Tax=Acacia crassicarpa TaxID=499986 RepID=A0AAE1MMG5_9FABA|nr:hypothetical protein QN277_019674 [Acacia crassicarpa]
MERMYPRFSYRIMRMKVRHVT